MVIVNFGNLGNYYHIIIANFAVIFTHTRAKLTLYFVSYYGFAIFLANRIAHFTLAGLNVYQKQASGITSFPFFENKVEIASSF